jgi:glycosyltransferase involved in cell wall biosynthesis
MDLLKAFSLFKKRQLSNMKLVLSGVGAIEKLDSYKYRQDVCLYPERSGGQMEGAYAVIHLPHASDPGIALLNAWRAGVPVITSSAEGLASGEIVLRVGANDPASLADGLKSLYKDEAFRKELIGKGMLHAAGLSVHQTVAAIWGVLGKEHEN